MQNEPNLCRFSAKNRDYDKIRTQYEPNTNPICQMLKMTITSAITIDYIKKWPFPPKKNEPNSNPIYAQGIKANLQNAQNQHNPIHNKRLHKKTPVNIFTVTQHLS